MADIYSLTIRADTRDVTRAKQALNGLANGSMKAQVATKRLAAESQGLARASRFSSNGLRNTSMQLSQVAQQASATGNWVQALAIQLPDLALAFGPVGIAVGAVAGGLLSYISSAQDAEDESKTLIERVDGLGVEYDDLNDSIRETLRLEKARAQLEIENQLAEQREQLRLAEQRVRSYNNALNATGQAGARFGGAVDSDKLQDASENAIELGGEIGFLELQLDETTKRYDEYINGTETAAEETANQAEKLESYVKAIESQAGAIGKSGVELAIYEANLLGAGKEERKAIRRAYEQIEAEKLRQEELKRTQEIARSMKVTEADDPLLQRIEAEKRGQEILLQQQKDYVTAREALDQNMLSSASSTAGNLAAVVGDLAGKQSAAYQAAFLAQQGFAIASAIVNTQMAAAAALAPPPIGLGPVAGAPYAAYIEGLGAANVAIIAAQTVAGLAGATSETDGARMHGGSVSAGGTYLVGEDGPEAVTFGQGGVVTPSSVLKGDGSGAPNITVNMIEDNSRAGTVEQRRTEDGGTEINAFVSDIASRGRRARMLEQTYGLRRQGR